MRDAFAEIERARSALWSLDPGCDAGEHFRIAAAYANGGGDFEEFNRWSEQAHNYGSESECRSVWKSASKPGSVTVATLFAAARAAGWSDGDEPPANRPQSRQEKRKPPEASKPPFHDPRAIWSACKPATIEQEYIERKLGLADDVRVYHGPLAISRTVCDGALVLPVKTLAGELVSLQLVPLAVHVLPNGPTKPFLPGAKLTPWPDACLTVGGPVKGDGVLYVVEGIAHAWSAHQATGRPAVVCFGWQRVASVAKALRKFYPNARLVIVPDVGKENQAAAIAKNVQGAWVELPPELGKNGDINDLHKSQGMKAVTGVLEGVKQPPSRFKLVERTANRLFVGEPPPVNWLVRGIFPLGACCLVASPPNVGKSFLSLDMAAKVAGYRGEQYAFGAAVAAHGRAVYVSAEDDEPEIHRRLWSLCDGVMPERLHVLSLPDVGHFGIIEADRQTKEYKATEAWRDLVAEIRDLSDVKLVLLDTLQALTTGDTNTVEATQPLMNEATALAAATGACVLLVHHVAKRSTQEIKISLDAMEAIRGSGAIAGTARAAYVLWPPSDGGKAVCEVLGEPYQEGKIAFGIVAKKYGDARRDRTVFVRDGRGILQDKTQQYKALSGTDDSDTLRTDLLQAIRDQWQIGQAFTDSDGAKGLHTRRHELPDGFQGKSRTWFDEQAAKLLADSSIKRLNHGNSTRLCPPDASVAVPKSVPEENAACIAQEAECDVPEVAA
jgi:hypothetical protein